MDKAVTYIRNRVPKKSEKQEKTVNNVIDIDGYGIAVVKEYYGKTGFDNEDEILKNIWIQIYMVC